MGLLSRFTQKQETSEAPESGEFRSRAEEESIQTRSRTKKTESRRKAKTDDPILPEKKRARRRLIGAVALALAAIIGLPMILDSDPKPLADDVNIRIPSKDKAFDGNAAASAEVVTPRAKNLAANEPVEEIIEPAPLPKNKTPNNISNATNTAVATVTNPPARLSNPPAAAQLSTVKPAKPELKPEVKPEPKADTKPVAKAEAKSEPKTEIKPVTATAKPAEKDQATAKAEVKTETKPVVAKPGNADDDAARALAILEGKTPPKPPVSKPAEAVAKSSFTVQAGAFSTQAKVDELQSRLKAADIKSYTQKIVTTNGEVTRIRVGPFASKEEADKMRAKLGKLGINASIPTN
ncbi:SPOR domain-containing protein [Undibacterium sp. CY18W]|uniref:SPOR domain-containing protein n=1 Tax=Undibacterium hunanense TaxID=2762292 RepID=A0ABR6ZLS7_9BURK|nr:SPOR domain-containing protein [Undibacterium hunanense]MBC3916365.1 SPOR domain-containing protein [Undibacterium hunanense]